MMPSRAYFESDLDGFRIADEDTILGVLARHHGFALEHEQKYAWQNQIRLLRHHLPSTLPGHVYFEFSIPRMGKRADVVLLANDVVFVIEFKVGASRFDRQAIEQVHDYALDLKNFHKGSHDLPVVPILIATAAPPSAVSLVRWASDQVAEPLCVSPADLTSALEIVLSQRRGGVIDPGPWSLSGYQPTPTIVEAALALYRQHNVKDITRSEAGADNLSVTASRVEQIIEEAKSTGRKAICFITGVPGAGKTLAGLNIATSRAERHSAEHAVFLSGNGPLVDVLREALARDKSQREGIPRARAAREVSTFVQNIHHFRDAALDDEKPPVEKVVVFDEAQRAWNREMTSRFMQQKRGRPTFDMSEPAFLLSVMDRHPDWCVVICLIGGGQEINTGEAGLGEWLTVLRDRFPEWSLYVSPRLEDRDYIWDPRLAKDLTTRQANWDSALHLGVSVRSFRAEALSDFVGHIVDNEPDEARLVYGQIADHYPMILTRDLDLARSWLRQNSRGSERYGITASSGASRLRAQGVWVGSKVDAPLWFLNERSDVRSSFYLEETATEFDVQGLELDWTCVCWDADFRRDASQWQCFSFRGTKWQSVKAPDRQLYIKNAYRVLLTRARQGVALYVPKGDVTDPTRKPEIYDEIYRYLLSCGIPTDFG
jgi:hypothetical protein